MEYFQDQEEEFLRHLREVFRFLWIIYSRNRLTGVSISRIRIYSDSVRLSKVMEERVENTITYARRHAVRVRNHAKLVDCYLEAYYKHKVILQTSLFYKSQIWMQERSITSPMFPRRACSETRRRLPNRSSRTPRSTTFSTRSHRAKIFPSKYKHHTSNEDHTKSWWVCNCSLKSILVRTMRLIASSGRRRYDLLEPEDYSVFFKLNPLPEFSRLKDLCGYVKGCPIDKLDRVIAYDLPQLLKKYQVSFPKWIAWNLSLSGTHSSGALLRSLWVYRER